MPILPNFWKNQLYGKKLYESVSDEYDSLPTKPKKNERERWHLRQMHSSRRVKYVAKWLASNIDHHHHSRNIEVRVQSVWIDLTPQAHFGFLDNLGVAQCQNCELSDLLAIVQVEDPTLKTMTKRAALLQAKVVSNWDRLDTPPSGSSSDVERNLLELSVGDVTVRKGTNATSSELAHSPYNLSGGFPGLADCARYLLIPSELKSTLDEPYRALWPQTRSQVTGALNSMGDLLLGMTGLTPWGHVAGKTVHPKSSSALDDWSLLVDDLVGMYSGPTESVKKFEAHTGSKIPRVVDSGPYSAKSVRSKLILKGRQLLTGLAFEVAMKIEAFTLKTSIAPFGNSQGGSRDGDGKFEDEEGGFMILNVTVTVTDAQRRD
jgi:hypothetical protein